MRHPLFHKFFVTFLSILISLKICLPDVLANNCFYSNNKIRPVALNVEQIDNTEQLQSIQSQVKALTDKGKYVHRGHEAERLLKLIELDEQLNILLNQDKDMSAPITKNVENVFFRIGYPYTGRVVYVCSHGIKMMELIFLRGTLYSQIYQNCDVPVGNCMMKSLDEVVLPIPLQLVSSIPNPPPAHMEDFHRLWTRITALRYQKIEEKGERIPDGLEKRENIMYMIGEQQSYSGESIVQYDNTKSTWIESMYHKGILHGKQIFYAYDSETREIRSEIIWDHGKMISRIHHGVRLPNAEDIDEVKILSSSTEGGKMQTFTATRGGSVAKINLIHRALETLQIRKRISVREADGTSGDVLYPDSFLDPNVGISDLQREAIASVLLKHILRIAKAPSASFRRTEEHNEIYMEYIEFTKDLSLPKKHNEKMSLAKHQLFQIGEGMALDLFLGNSDRTLGKYNGENILIDKTGDLHFIDTTFSVLQVYRMCYLRQFGNIPDKRFLQKYREELKIDVLEQKTSHLFSALTEIIQMSMEEFSQEKPISFLQTLLEKIYLRRALTSFVNPESSTRESQQIDEFKNEIYSGFIYGIQSIAENYVDGLLPLLNDNNTTSREVQVLAKIFQHVQLTFYSHVTSELLDKLTKSEGFQTQIRPNKKQIIGYSFEIMNLELMLSSERAVRRDDIDEQTESFTNKFPLLNLEKEHRIKLKDGTVYIRGSVAYKLLNNENVVMSLMLCEVDYDRVSMASQVANVILQNQASVLYAEYKDGGTYHSIYKEANKKFYYDMVEIFIQLTRGDLEGEEDFLIKNMEFDSQYVYIDYLPQENQIPIFFNQDYIEETDRTTLEKQLLQIGELLSINFLLGNVSIPFESGLGDTFEVDSKGNIFVFRITFSLVGLYAVLKLVSFPDVDVISNTDITDLIQFDYSSFSIAQIENDSTYIHTQIKELIHQFMQQFKRDRKIDFLRRTKLFHSYTKKNYFNNKGIDSTRVLELISEGFVNGINNVSQNYYDELMQVKNSNSIMSKEARIFRRIFNIVKEVVQEHNTILKADNILYNIDPGTGQANTKYTGKIVKYDIHADQLSTVEYMDGEEIQNIELAEMNSYQSDDLLNYDPRITQVRRNIYPDNIEELQKTYPNYKYLKLKIDKSKYTLQFISKKKKTEILISETYENNQRRLREEFRPNAVQMLSVAYEDKKLHGRYFLNYLGNTITGDYMLGQKDSEWKTTKIYSVDNRTVEETSTVVYSNGILEGLTTLVKQEKNKNTNQKIRENKIYGHYYQNRKQGLWKNKINIGAFESTQYIIFDRAENPHVSLVYDKTKNEIINVFIYNRRIEQYYTRDVHDKHRRNIYFHDINTNHMWIFEIDLNTFTLSKISEVSMPKGVKLERIFIDDIQREWKLIDTNTGNTLMKVIYDANFKIVQFVIQNIHGLLLLEAEYERGYVSQLKKYRDGIIIDQALAIKSQLLHAQIVVEIIVSKGIQSYAEMAEILKVLEPMEGMMNLPRRTIQLYTSHTSRLPSTLTSVIDPNLNKEGSVVQKYGNAFIASKGRWDTVSKDMEFRIGEWQWRYDNGHLAVKGQYNANGDRIGEWIVLDRLGFKMWSIIYDISEEVQTVQQYHQGILKFHTVNINYHSDQVSSLELIKDLQEMKIMEQTDLALLANITVENITQQIDILAQQ